MTADELKKLAEIAGLIYNENKGYGYYFDSNIDIFFIEEDWQPHFRIEQAYSVENGIPEEKRREYIYQLIIATGQQGLPPTYNAWNLVHATADQRCRAALAAAKEG